MRTLRHALLILPLVLSAASAKAQSNPNAARGSVVKGVARFDDTNQPAPRARVQLVPVEALAKRGGPNRIPTTISDANGEFVLANTPPGDYYVVANSADAKVPSGESSPVPVQTGDAEADAAKLEQYKKDYPRITVTPDRPVEINVRVKNFHFGSISGRILNASGTPVPRAQVHVMQKGGERGFGGSQVAEEDGTYRFRGLPAGEYVVSAAPGSKEPAAQGTRSVQGVLRNTYFPSTVDPNLSPPVVVPPDGEIGEINITLAPLNLHSVSGTVLAEGDRHSIAGATVRLSKKGIETSTAGVDAAMTNYFSTTDAQGRWTLNNVPDGEYMLDVRPAAIQGTGAERFVAIRQDLTIGGSDVENLAIEVSLGARVSGQVTIDQGKTSMPAISIGIGTANDRVQASGAFTVTGVPEGEFPLAVMIRPPNVFYAKSIEVDGVNLLREKLKVKAGAEIKDVRVSVAPASILTGRVLSASARTPLSKVNVALIAVDPATAPAFQRPNGATNTQGSFVVSGAPGEYFVLLWGQGEPMPPHDVESIKKLNPETMRVTLGPGERKSIELLK